MVTFTDRVPTYPGRVRLTPVAGQTNVYDLTREDDPVVAGTPLNAALFQAFAQVEIGSYTGTGSGTVPLTFSFKPDVVIITSSNSDYKNTCIGVLVYGASYGAAGQQGASTSTDGGFINIATVWSSNGVTFTPDDVNNRIALNTSAVEYYYAAFGRGV